MGYNRHEKKGKLQIVFGLLCTSQGCPVAVEGFEGDTGDPSTLEEQIRKIRERFGLTPAGFVLAVIGVCWLSLASEVSEGAPRPVLGNFLEFAAMVCATGYTLTLKKLSARYTPLFLTAIQAFIGALFFLPGLWGALQAAFRQFQFGGPRPDSSRSRSIKSSMSFLAPSR